MSVLHSKSLWNCAQLDKAQSLIQMAGVNIAFYNSIELKKFTPKDKEEWDVAYKKFLEIVAKKG